MLPQAPAKDEVESLHCQQLYHLFNSQNIDCSLHVERSESKRNLTSHFFPSSEQQVTDAQISFHGAKNVFYNAFSFSDDLPICSDMDLSDKQRRIIAFFAELRW